jgi:cell division protein FtsL
MIWFLRSAFIPGLIMLGISAAFLFAIKYTVQNLRTELKNINYKILSERENIHVLNAEISYLTNPKRIKSLTDEKLSLRAPKREQIISVEALNEQLRQNMLAMKQEQLRTESQEQ